MNFDDDNDEIFRFNSLNLTILQNNEILGIGVSSKYLLLTNKKNEMFCWFNGNDDSLRTPIQIPLLEKEKGYFTKFYCDEKGHNTIFKHNKFYYYFNTRAMKIKQLTKLNDLMIESVAFDINAGDSSTGTILLGTDRGKIFTFSIDFDFKNDKLINEKLVEMITIKNEKKISGIAVIFF